MKRYSLLFFASCLSLSAHAFHWQDLWATADQQGQDLMAQSKFKEAKNTFARNDWAATAAYRAGDYQKAAELYRSLNTEEGHYNEGNALAHLGKYEDAIKAYNNALAINPKDPDALYNKKLLEDLLKKDKNQKQNKEQQNKEQQNKEQQNKEQQNKEQQNKEQQNKEQQNKEQQNKEQQNKEQQNKEQQNKEQQNKEQQNKTPQELEAEREKQQAKDQWLRLIPDDPGGLLRQKFLRDHLRRERGWYQ